MSLSQLSHQRSNVVLLPPAGADRRIWWKVAEQLESTEDLHFPDFLTDRLAESAEPRFDALAAELSDWASSQALEQFVLVGVSLGGMLAQYFAAQFPHRVAGMVIGNTNFMQSSAQMQNMRLRAAWVDENFPAYVHETVNRWFSDRFRLENPDDVAFTKEILMSVPAAAHTGAWNLISTLDTQDLLPRISCPVSVIGGYEDVSTPLEVQKEIHDRLPKAKLLPVHAGHMSCVESPDSWAAAIQELLR